MIISVADDGSELYILRIPRAKQRGHGNRETFKFRSCDARLGRLLKALIAFNVDKKLSRPSTSVDWPLFISKKLGRLPGFEYHYSAQELGFRLLKAINSVSPIHANSKRFRHTLAKRANDDGADILVIAELLDHNDTQNVKVYTEGNANIIDRLNRTVAMEMAATAQAFAGILITRDDINAHRTGHGKQIHQRNLPNGVQALGSCGTSVYCGLPRPLACYSCPSFRPWDDGPHGEMLDSLIADREIQRDNRYSPHIVTVNDNTIVKVAQVIKLCDEVDATSRRALE